MCDPVSGVVSLTSVAAYAGITASVAGAGMAYMSAQRQAAATSAQMNYQAQIAANDKILADRSAVAAVQSGDVAAQQKANATAQLIGRQKTGFAANGIDPNSGSATDLTSDTASAGELDQLTIHSNAAREAAGFTAQGTNYANQAVLDQAASSDALAGGALKGASTIIGGAGTVASQWYNFTSGTRLTGQGALG